MEAPKRLFTTPGISTILPTHSISRNMSILIGILTVFLSIVALLMILLILMQRPKQEGLGATFGAGMAESMFGAGTTDILQKATVWLAGIFLSVMFIISILISNQSRQSGAVDQSILEQAAANSEKPEETTSKNTPPAEEETAPAAAEKGDDPESEDSAQSDTEVTDTAEKAAPASEEKSSKKKETNSKESVDAEDAPSDEKADSP